MGFYKREYSIDNFYEYETLSNIIGNDYLDSVFGVVVSYDDNFHLLEEPLSLEDEVIMANGLPDDDSNITVQDLEEYNNMFSKL